MRNAPTWQCRKFAHQDQKIGARPEWRAEGERESGDGGGGS